MAWIKRNLYFVIGGAVALALMGLAGWYLYSKWVANEAILAKLSEDYALLDDLNNRRPHPGSGQVDNIKRAKEQEQQLRSFIQTARKDFQRIPPIPDQPKLTDQAVSAALTRTIAQMQKDATNASVILPPNYNFSFEAEKPKISFAVGSLEPLAVQLGEVKTICDVLFKAKINSLDGIRRERISSDDYNQGAAQTDYLPDKSMTNELAVLAPYELTFRCFSTELAGVLAGFASSPYALFVKSINVEPAPATATMEPVAAAPVYVPAAPAAVQPATDMQAAFARRYGIGMGGGDRRYGGGPSVGEGGIPLRPLAPTAPAPYYPPAAQPAAQPGAAPGANGLATVLDERQLKITINLDVVKLLPPAK